MDMLNAHWPAGSWTSFQMTLNNQAIHETALKLQGSSYYQCLYMQILPPKIRQVLLRAPLHMPPPPGYELDQTIGLFDC